MRACVLCVFAACVHELHIPLRLGMFTIILRTACVPLCIHAHVFACASLAEYTPTPAYCAHCFLDLFRLLHSMLCVTVESHFHQAILHAPSFTAHLTSAISDRSLDEGCTELASSEGSWIFDGSMWLDVAR